ncbi:cobalamin biosynthesis protein [Kitasatospora sp. NPDC057965]|uniref:cobalamin biosynthesis protein n=1 Tax=Kitasatospora sp. NPDC057965 TaxID=3346291 RepID=UPI0036D9608E
MRGPDGNGSDGIGSGALGGPGDGSDVAAPGRGRLVVGVGVRGSATAAELLDLIRHTLAAAGLPAGAVGTLATLDGKGGHPAVRSAAAALGVPVAEYPAAALAAVPVPNPSGAVGDAVGTASVAEAAALTGAGGGRAELVVPKRRSAAATVAVARAPRPPAAHRRPQPRQNPGEQP